MSNSLTDLVQLALNLAKENGAQHARASVSRSRQSSVEWRDGKLDRLRESTEHRLGLAVFVDGRYSSNTTSDVRPAALESFVREIVGITRILTRDEHRKLADPSTYGNRFEGDLQQYDAAGPKSISPAYRRRFATQLEQATRAALKDQQVVSITATWKDTDSEQAMATSNGMLGSERSTSFTTGAAATIRDHGDKKPVGYWYASCRYLGDLPPVERVAEETAQRAKVGLGQRPLKSGTYPCVVENLRVSRLLQGLLEPFHGQAIQQRRSFVEGRQGKLIASPLLTIIDDPHVARGLSSQRYDGEGMSSRKRPLIEKGILRTFLLDTYYASKLGVAPTTGSSSNLVFQQGTKNLNELLASMRDGILITDFIGGNANSATGDFSVGIRGQRIENGKPVEAVAEMNLSGNHLQLWKQLAEVGNDPHPYGSTRSPSLRFNALQFSGV